MEIDVTEYTNRLDLLAKYMNYFIDELAYKERAIYRVIFNKPVDEDKGGLFTPAPPRKFASVHHMEFTTIRWHQHPMKGYGTKPDSRMSMIGKDIEVWKLWQNNKIKPFE